MRRREKDKEREREREREGERKTRRGTVEGLAASVLAETELITFSRTPDKKLKTTKTGNAFHVKENETSDTKLKRKNNFLCFSFVLMRSCIKIGQNLLRS